MKFGDYLKKARKEKKMSQKELAEKLSIPASTLANYENNHREPNYETLNRIAAVLDIAPGELLGKEDLNIDSFDSRVVNYIDNLKIMLNSSTDAEIGNALIIQNIIINIVAKRDAKLNAGTYSPKPMLEFSLDGDGKPITGDQLYKMLYKKYFDEAKEKKINHRIFKDGISDQDEASFNDEE